MAFQQIICARVAHLPVSFTSENMNGRSVFGPDLTPSLDAIPVPNKKRPGATKPSRRMYAHESTPPS